MKSNIQHGVTMREVTRDVTALMLSEGIQVVEGCSRGRSLAGAILSVRYGVPRLIGESAVERACGLIKDLTSEAFA